jgi:class 3 adenylate cyclase
LTPPANLRHHPRERSGHYHFASAVSIKSQSHPRKLPRLFSDFSNFTPVSGTFSASELVEELNRCFCLFDGLCGRHGIEKLKTIGDGYFSLSGNP